MNHFEQLHAQIPLLEEKLCYSFQNKSLLILAFTHRSFLNENRELTCEHNERLEFLGDAILDLLASEYLYLKLPDYSEGELSRLRSRLVEASACLSYIQKWGVEKYILLGKGEKMNDGRGRDSILSDLFEAIIGAIYLDSGFEETKKFLLHHFTESFEEIIKQPAQNWKALLQDYSQKKYQQTPVYEVQEAIGPDHSKIFSIVVYINGQEVGSGKGSSKKEAQQAAAADALSHVDIHTL